MCLKDLVKGAPVDSSLMKKKLGKAKSSAIV